MTIYRLSIKSPRGFEIHFTHATTPEKAIEAARPDTTVDVPDFSLWASESDGTFWIDSRSNYTLFSLTIEPITVHT